MLQTGLFLVQAVQAGPTAERAHPSAKGLSSQTERIQGLPSKALLIGCNYHETRFALRGCINDVLHIKSMLIKAYRMQPNNITTMTVRSTSPSAHSGIAAQSNLICAQSIGLPHCPKALLPSRNASTVLLCQEFAMPSRMRKDGGRTMLQQAKI